MLLMAQVEQHTAWEELNTLLNITVQPKHAAPISSLVIWTPRNKLISPKMCPFQSLKLKQARVRCPGLKLADLVPFGCTVLPQNAAQMHFCSIRAQQEGAEIRWVKGQKSETGWEWWLSLQVATTNPLWGSFFTPVYRTSVRGCILRMWGKTVVTYDFRTLQNPSIKLLTRNFPSSCYQLLSNSSIWYWNYSI